jgi:hypothetical protein
MKKHVLAILFLLLAGLSFAQPKDTERKDRLKAHKIAFISTELELSPEEAEKFWPIYNELDAKLEVLLLERRGMLKKMHHFVDLSDDEAYELTTNIFAIEAKQTQLRLDYLPKFAEVIGKKKAAQVYLAEEKFKRELLKKLKNREHDYRKGGPGGGGGQKGGNGGSRN